MGITLKFGLFEPFCCRENFAVLPCRIILLSNEPCRFALLNYSGVERTAVLPYWIIPLCSKLYSFDECVKALSDERRRNYWGRGYCVCWELRNCVFKTICCQKSTLTQKRCQKSVEKMIPPPPPLGVSIENCRIMFLKHSAVKKSKLMLKRCQMNVEE